jgi:hypothetical protein
VAEAQQQRDDENAWERLRLREVVQWGLAYAAAAWALLQVIRFAADALHWPDVVKQFSMLALAIGLPVALMLAWYHGARGEQHESHDTMRSLGLAFVYAAQGRREESLRIGLSDEQVKALDFVVAVTE